VKALHQQLKDENKRNLIISLISKRKGYAQQIQQMTSRWNSFKTNSTEKKVENKSITRKKICKNQSNHRGRSFS